LFGAASAHVGAERESAESFRFGLRAEDEHALQARFGENLCGHNQTALIKENNQSKPLRDLADLGIRALRTQGAREERSGP
jgi:hypothetical protein